MSPVFRTIAGIIFIYCGVFCTREKPKNVTSQRMCRCVSLVPSVTEIIYAVGAGDLLVGNTNQCDFPAAARRTYKVGDFQMPDLERIVFLKPDVVFATLPVHQRLIERFRELGIRVFVSAPRNVDEVFAEIESVGVILDRAEQARALVADLRAHLDSLSEVASPLKVYVEISAAPLITVGRGVFINDVIRKAGGRNVFENINSPYPVIEPEMVVQADPDVILILHPGTMVSEVGERLGWSRISAVRAGRVYNNLNEDLLLRPGPRIVDGIRLLVQLFRSSGRADVKGI